MSISVAKDALAALTVSRHELPPERVGHMIALCYRVAKYYSLKGSQSMTQLYVKVRPDSEEFRIEKGTYPKIYLENEAENGRANAELLNKLEELTGERPGIVSGHKSRRKKISLDMSKKEFERRVERELDE